MAITFTKKELLTLLVAAIVIALTIAFDDKQPAFILKDWLMNYLATFLLTLLALTIFASATKWQASKSKSAAHIELWSITRVGWSASAKAKTPFYTGVIIPLMLAILSGGKVPFGAATKYSLQTNPVHRIGKEFIRLTDYEQAKIATYAPTLLTFIAVIMRLFNSPLADRLSYIMLVIAVTNMLPLPSLNGMKAFFGSRLLYIFTSAMILITLPLINVVKPLTLILIAFIFGIFILFFTYEYDFVKA